MLKKYVTLSLKYQNKAELQNIIEIFKIKNTKNCLIFILLLKILSCYIFLGDNEFFNGF